MSGIVHPRMVAEAHLQCLVHSSRDVCRLVCLPHMLAEALDSVLLVQLLEATLTYLC